MNVRSWILCLPLLLGSTIPLAAADYVTSYWGGASPPPTVLPFASLTSWRIQVGANLVNASALPGAGDTVTITQPTSADAINVGTLILANTFSYVQITANRVTLSDKTFPWRAGISASVLEVVGGTLVLEGSTTVPVFRISGGLVEGTGTLVMTGSDSLLSGGLLGGSTVVDFAPGSAVSISPAQGNLVVWESARLRLRGAATLNTHPEGTHLAIGDAATVEVAAGGVLTTTDTGSIVPAAGGQGRHLEVHGTLIADAPQGSSITVPLQIGPTGSVTVRAGRTLAVAGSDMAGTIHTEANSTFTVLSGTFTQASSLTGPGRFQYSGGDITITAGGSFGELEVIGGLVRIEGSISTTTLRMQDGVLAGSGTLAVTGSGSLLTGGSLSGNGLVEFSAGSTVSFLPTHSSVLVNEARRLRIGGTATLTTIPTSYALGLGEAAEIELAAGGLLTTTSGEARIVPSGGNSGRHLVISGTLIADAPSGSGINVPLLIGDTGQVVVNQGTLTTSTTANAGIIEILSGATWAFSPSDVSFTGNGLARGIGTLKPAATWALDQIRLDPGQTSAITGTLSIAGAVSGRIPALPILVNGALADRLAITGSIGAAPVDLAFSVGTAPTEASYTLVSWTSGSAVPSIGTVTGRPAGYALAVDPVNRAIVLKADPVQGFVTRFYSQVLNRAPDAAGLDDWTAQLNAGTRTGASLAYGFVFSQEFIGRNLTNEAFVDTLYSAFFNRAADAGGKAGWLAQLNGGTLREDVLNGFLFATEFSNLCASYGIAKYSAADAQKKQIRDFVRRFYQQCLNREPDAAGATDWANQLIAGTRTGATLAEGFVGSQEFIGRGLTDDQFLAIMYKAFFDREGDAGGLAGWKADLAAGKPRLQVVAGFTHAQEFINLCASYGITPFSAGG